MTLRRSAPPSAPTVFQFFFDFLIELSRDGDGVATRQIVVHPKPFCHPALPRVHDRRLSLVECGRTGIDLLRIVNHFQKRAVLQHESNAADRQVTKSKRRWGKWRDNEVRIIGTPYSSGQSQCNATQCNQPPAPTSASEPVRAIVSVRHHRLELASQPSSTN